MDKKKILEHASQIGGTKGRSDYALHLFEIANKLPKDCRILEIGSAAGGSATTMALTVKERNGVVFAIDPIFVPPSLRGSRYKKFDLLGDLYSFIWNVSMHEAEGYVIPLPGSSEEVLKRWDGRLFDLIFIDGDHTYSSVKIDLQWSKYTKVQAYIAIDDLMVEPRKACQEFLKEHLEWSLRNPKYYPWVFEKRRDG